MINISWFLEKGKSSLLYSSSWTWPQPFRLPFDVNSCVMKRDIWQIFTKVQNTVSRNTE